MTIRFSLVIISFDFPNLLKGIRNNMLNCNVHFKWKGGEEVASWININYTNWTMMSRTSACCKNLQMSMLSKAKSR
jgi:hypothetical protein